MVSEVKGINTLIHKHIFGSIRYNEMAHTETTQHGIAQAAVESAKSTVLVINQKSKSKAQMLNMAAWQRTLHVEQNPL